eukprot:243441_1
MSQPKEKFFKGPTQFIVDNEYQFWIKKDKTWETEKAKKSVKDRKKRAEEDFLLERHKFGGGVGQYKRKLGSDDPFIGEHKVMDPLTKEMYKRFTYKNPLKNEMSSNNNNNKKK